MVDKDKSKQELPESHTITLPDQSYQPPKAEQEKEHDMPGASKKRSRGRPVEKPMPEPIPDTAENIARAIMRGPPKKEWDYMKAVKARDSKDG